VFERYSESAQDIVALAEEEADGLGHAYIGTEHLLLGLLSDRHNAVARALPAGTTLQVVRRKVEEAVGNSTGGPVGELSFSPRAKRALERASRFSLQLHAPHVEANHVVLGVLDVEGRAGQVLRGLGVDVGRVRDAAQRTGEPAAAAPGAEPASPQKPSAPRCPACGAALDATLAWRALPAKGEGGEVRTFVVAYCAACESSLGTAPGAT
jgi:ATP-dependent Clp protease ATP-binding subunit ClpA